MRRDHIGAHTKTDLKGHLLWIPKYGKRVRTGPVAVRARAGLRPIAVEHELDLITGQGGSDNVHRFLQDKPQQDLSKLVQGLKGISSSVRLQEFAHRRKQFWGRQLWARGYRAVRSGNSTEELSQKSIEEQEGAPMLDDSRLTIDS